MTTNNKRTRETSPRIIDYTSFVKTRSASGLPIEVCPKCGRKGEHKRFKSGEEEFTHRKDNIGSIFWRVTDYCFLPKVKKAQHA